jgi:energy-coupling factor transport system ATP-binding protein
VPGSVRSADLLVQVDSLRYVYNPGTPQARVALDGITLDIARGEYLAVVGPNGSGKSTLAKCLNALLRPTDGQVLVDGLDTRDQERAWNIRQRVGMVFQNPDNQIVATVVEEDVAFGPENLGLPAEEIRRRVQEALRVVDMWEYRQHAPHLLSGGQKQRVAIAGVLAMRPACLILDEATTMLDREGRVEVLNTVARLNHEEAITIVHITHAMDEAVLARRVLVLGAGRLVLEGSPAEVFARREELRALRLVEPPIVRLAEELRKAGMPISASVLTVDALAESIVSVAARRASARAEPGAATGKDGP